MQIDIKKEFLSNIELDNFEQEILNGALNLNSGQSSYQSKYFVANSQLTPYRKLKQCLLELETRHNSWFNINNKMKKKAIEIKMAKRDLETTNDELQKEFIQIEIEDMEHDLGVWQRKIKQAEEEVFVFINLIKEIADGDQELLEKAYGYDEEEEQKYWITRMAKQAAMDLVAYGRIGSGNMDSIAMMPEEDQVMALATCLQYNERLLGGMSEISNAVNQGLLKNTENLPKYSVPVITENLLTKEILENVQCTIESKTKSESI